MAQKAAPNKKTVTEDPRFTELLYPDPGADLESTDSVGQEESI